MIDVSVQTKPNPECFLPCGENRPQWELIDPSIIHVFIPAWPGAHLKWLIQGEIDGAVTGRCAVPGEVPGAAVARTGDVHTSVINLDKWSREFEK